MPLIFCDFETRSECDLKARAAYAYAEDPTTEAICLFIEHESGWRVLWTPVAYPGWTPPEGVEHRWGLAWLHQLFSDPTNIFVAHNCEFDQAIAERCLHLPERQWIDTMALANYLALPASLDDLANHLWGTGKDKDGFLLMMKLCKPRSSVKGDFHPITNNVLTLLTIYNIRDVELMRRFWDEYFRDWPDVEEGVFRVHNAVNRRGIMMDNEAVSGLIHLTQEIAGCAGTAVETATRGLAFNGKSMELFGKDLTRVAYLKNWFNKHADGLWHIDSVDEETMTAMLAQADDVVSPVAKRVAEARLSISLASVKKLQTAQRQICADGRLRGQYNYAAAHTHRWKGRGVQLQNLPRTNPWLEEEPLHKPNRPQANLMTGLLDACRAGKLQQFFQAAAAVDAYAKSKKGPEERVSVNDVLTSLIRPMFVPAPGHKFVGADFAQIEGRGAAWLAGDKKSIEAFVNNDRDPDHYPDIYCVMASVIYGTTVTKSEKPKRQVGKVAELGCGYGQGASKFGMMNGADLAKAGVTAEFVVQKWRDLHRPIVDYWYELENAMRKAVQVSRGQRLHKAGIAEFERIDAELVRMHFPSGRSMHYHNARLEVDDRSDVDGRTRLAYSRYPKGADEVREVTTWGGSLLENYNQSLCRDLLTDVMVRCEDAGPPIVMHTHDEVLTEVPDAYAAEVSEWLGHEMSKGPAWAEGFPLKGDPSVLIRYGK
jgi:DNA polymerase bacteriophage-type